MPETKSTFERVREILIEEFDVEEHQVLPDAKLADHPSFDSLDAVEIVVAVEEEFKLAITDEDLLGVTTVNELVALVDRLVAAKA